VSANARWWVKKAARRSVASAAWLARRVGPNGSEPVVRAITYHRFADEAKNAFCVSPAVFEAQMRWLAENGLALSLEQVEAFVAGRFDPKPGSVLVTMDDGYASVLEVAAPILREYAIPAVAYVSTAIVGDPAASMGLVDRYMDWDELARLQASGVTIGSHGHTHRSFGRLDPDDLRAESSRPRELIEQRLGRAPSSFAYPFGTPAHYSDESGHALSAAGFRTGFLSTHGAIRRGLDPIALPRVKVEGGEGPWMFEHSCRGAMDAWAVIDHAVCRLRGERRIRR
jgi:peptidoglycan/xylan/chitin deacetylase (PgdA/CDA1 family)